MSLFRKIFIMLVLLGAAQAYAAGKEYKVLNPAQPVSGNKIEVVEFFFYECPHCYHMHGVLSAWEKQMPKDVELKFVPVVFRESLEPMARTFYALEALGQQERLHNALFEAWHVYRTDLSDEARITNFVAKHGVDRAKFTAAYNSFSIGSKLRRSDQMVGSFGVRGTPTIAVDGKYTISDLQPEDAIRVLNEVIEIARKERRAGKH